MNSTAIPWRIFFYRIPLARRMKDRIPQGWMIPQYRPLKSKLPKYRLKESSIPQYRKLYPMPPSVREKWVEVWDTGNLKTALYHTLAFRAFSLTWPASMLIYWNKRKFLHKKRVQLPQDWFGTPTWPPFHCFRTLIWQPWRHVKTLYLQKIPDFNRGAITTS